jgi:hypothetical protein
MCASIPYTKQLLEANPVATRIGRNLGLALAAILMLASTGGADVEQLQKSFVQPSDDARIMVRWWWFGPAVTKAQLEREMNFMKQGGIGGFEVQPTYPLALDDERPGLKNLKFMSPDFLEMLRFTAAKAKELGLRMDLTLGSGWPYGGPWFSEMESTGALQTQAVQVPEGARSIQVPQIGESWSILAAMIGKGNSGIGARGGGGRGGPAGDARGGRGGVAAGGPDGMSLKPVAIKGGVVEIPSDAPTPAEVVFFISGQTGGTRGMAVKRPAYGADGPVIDHLSDTVVDKFIKLVGEPELAACGSNPPYAVFCDSLEVNGENWTPNFLEEFKKRRGYDLTPLLPALVADMGPKTAEIRQDWGQTVTELFNDHFNAKFKKLANDHGSKYRIQGYGSPPAALFSYAYTDLPEGEGFTWRGFSNSRWASSASHLLGKPITSSETFTWLKQAVFYATPLDIKAEANMHFLEGVNQIICHGWPYTAEGAEYPGWSFYAAAAFNEKNPWWIVMPDVTRYLQRCSSILRQGAPSNDVAVFLSNGDAWSNRSWNMGSYFGGTAGNAARAILDAGYNFDFFDDQLLAMRGKVEGKALAFGDSKYRVVVLPYAERIQPATMKKLDEFAKNGGVVIALGNAPSIAPGYKATDEDQKVVRDISQRLFEGASAAGALVQSENDLATAISKKLAPDLKLEGASGEVGFVHRHTDSGEVYFIANTGNQLQNLKATFRNQTMQPEIWDPMSGMVSAAAGAQKSSGGTTMNIKLEPYGSTVVAFTSRKVPATPPVPIVAPVPAPIDLSSGWTVKFGSDGPTVKMDELQSWTQNDQIKAFSGVATYSRQFKVDAAMVKKGVKVMLNLGFASGPQMTGSGGRGGNGFRSNLETPVREAAVVYINDKKVGSVWAPPYSIDVTGVLQAGNNQIRIEVGNLAINYMAAHGYPNYNMAGVRQKFGNRFDPQGLNNLQPLPSGLLGPIKLEAAGSTK